MEQYLVVVITNGGPRIEWLDKTTLEKYLSAEIWGNIKWLAPLGDNSGGILTSEDVGYGLIIKGLLVKPQEKLVVKEYKIE